MEERRGMVRRRADRELYELIEKKTGVKPEQLVRDRKLRRAIRHTCRAVLEIDMSHSAGETGHWESDTHRIKARVLDLSEGGASIFSRYNLTPGAHVILGIKLYDGQTIESRSEVRWSKPKEHKGGFALGLQFVEMDNTNRTRLERFLTEMDATLGLGAGED